MLYARGYSTARHNTLQSAYFNNPTPLQKASFRSHLIALVHSGNAGALRAHLACGLSPNPANSFGESLVHKVCRVGRSRLLQVLLDNSHSQGGVYEDGDLVRVADENGRTPLHEACAANSLECFELLCEQDLRMLYMADRHNCLPLQFVPKSAWPEWIQFLEAKKDEYWPAGQRHKFGGGAGQEEPPPLFTLQAPHSRPLKDPPNALPCDVATQVASGELKPEMAVIVAKRQLLGIGRQPHPLEDEGSLVESLSELPLPRRLIHVLNGGDDADDVSDIYDSDQTESDEEFGGDDDDHSSVPVSESDYGSEDDHDLDDHVNPYAAAKQQSLDLAGLEQAMGVLGISPRARISC